MIVDTKDVSNNRGANFERLVGTLLSSLQLRHPEVVKVVPQKRIHLNNGTYDIADFELTCELPHQIDHRLIECQDRKRSDRDIARKIRNIKGLSDKNRFIFVFKDEGFLTEAVRKDLESDGVVYYSLIGFASFLNQLSTTLGAVVGRSKKFDFVDVATTLEKFPLFDEFYPVLRPALGMKSPDQFAMALKSQSKQKDEGMVAEAEPRYSDPFRRW